MLVRVFIARRIKKYVLERAGAKGIHTNLCGWAYRMLSLKASRCPFGLCYGSSKSAGLKNYPHIMQNRKWVGENKSGFSRTVTLAP